MKICLMLLVLFFGVGITLLRLIQSDAGYVMVSLSGWTFETSFWFAIAVLIVIALFCLFTWRLLRFSFRSLLKGGSLIRSRRHQVIERRYREGLLNFLTGDYHQANKQLSSVSKRNELPVVRVIATAQALAKEGNFGAANKILKAAEEKYPQDLNWLYKARALLLIEFERDAEADLVIEKLKLINPEDGALPRLEHLKSSQKQNWQHASDLLSDKKLAKSLQGDEVKATYTSALTQLGEDPSLDEASVNELWQKIPKEMKVDADLLVPYAELLQKTKQYSLLEELIEYTLEKHWLPDLVDLYSKLDLGEPEQRLRKAERWLKAHKDDQVLAMSLGILAIKSQLWGKARAYFEDANKIKEHPRALYFLGYICERLKQTEESSKFFKRAAELAY